MYPGVEDCGGLIVAKKAAKKSSRTKRRAWTKSDIASLKQRSKQKSPVVSIARTLKTRAVPVVSTLPPVSAIPGDRGRTV